MTVTVDLLPQSGLLIGTVEGHPRLAVFGSLARASIRFDVLQGNARVIIDVRRQTGSSLTASIIHAYISRYDRTLAKSNSKVEFAYILEPESIGYGIARMILAYSEMAQNIKVNLFETPQQLDDWSGVKAVLEQPRVSIPLPGALGSNPGTDECEVDWQCSSLAASDGCPACFPERTPCVKGLMNGRAQSI